MKLLPHILNRIVIIRAEIAADDICATEVFVWQRGRLAAAGWADAKGAPAIVVVCGHGVVTKEADSQVAARVKSDPATFLWSSAGGQITFVRRDRLRGLEETLAGQCMVPVQFCCSDVCADFEAAAGHCQALFQSSLRWRNLWRSNDVCSSVAQAFIRRTALPVTGLFFMLLAGNMLLSKRISSRLPLLQAEVALRERTARDAASTGDRQQKLLESFAAKPGISRAAVCDRVAQAVPQRVVLTLLGVEPLAGRFETGKPLLRREGVVLVAGTAPAAADISEFVRQLGDRFREVRLAEIEREREGVLLNFKIEIGL